MGSWAWVRLFAPEAGRVFWRTRRGTGGCQDFGVFLTWECVYSKLTVAVASMAPAIPPASRDTMAGVGSPWIHVSASASEGRLSG
jgi:hypothetical protein